MGLKLENVIELVKQPSGEIMHLISTLPGQSGSPIVDVSKKTPCVIGIHKGSKLTVTGDQFNIGRILTEKIIC